MRYSKPPIDSLPFRFTDAGYQKPDFGGVPFRIGLRTSTTQVSDLQGAINVMGVYQASTYTYLKECPTIVVGYVQSGVQILKLPCIYGGIRDLGASLHGWQAADFPSYIYGIPPRDLQAILNVIEIRDLPTYVIGVWWKGQKDLGGLVQDIFLREYLDLPILIHGWDTKELQGLITAVYFRDLGASISPFTGIDLPAYVLGIGARLLYANIHGWDTKDLVSYAIGAYGPGDLQASLNTVPSQNMNAYIRGFKGIQIPFNLVSYLEGSYARSLSAFINIIDSANLSAYITPTGKSANLGAVLIPKTILIRKAVLISLLEHKNLPAMINFMCMLSDGKNLSAYVYALMKSDLRANIIGWYGSTSDNIKDLSAYINSAVYEVQDRLEFVRFVPYDAREKYTLLKIRFSSMGVHYVTDTIDVKFESYYNRDLTAQVEGILTSSNLSASLTPQFDLNYTELPPWIIPKTHEVVINLEKLEEQWKLFVEIMFDHAGDDDFHYFYINAEQKVYRLERDRHWTIWVKSYIPDDTSIIDRRNVRFKYGFNMSNYNSVDEAVRDLIDRVSSYRKANLSAQITAYHPETYKNLNAVLQAKFVYRWNESLNSLINAVSPVDLSASITGI